jgi:hypothetical protein
MFSSELLKLAREVDKVDIKIEYGYKFERGIGLFTKYVEHYFKLKQKAEEDNNEGLRFISKLMLNSLYGRFGLKYLDSRTKILSSAEVKELSLKYQILDNFIIDADEEIEMVKHSLKPADILKKINQESYFNLLSNYGKQEDYINKSLPISAMITSYAACFMNKFLNIPGNECYYSDTDCAVLKYPLDSKYVGSGLGQFKFIGKAKRAYFITPKLYCLVLENGKTIIKSKGIDSLNLNENDFIEMLYGLNITKQNNYKFKIDFNKFTVNYSKYDFTISSKISKRKPIYENYKIVDTLPLKVNNGILEKYFGYFDLYLPKFDKGPSSGSGGTTVPSNNPSKFSYQE